jgi:predicted Fe-S protein YdhL (DUF1289 family)
MRHPHRVISACKIDPATRWCVGCLRSLDEIGAWANSSDDDKRAVLGPYCPSFEGARSMRTITFYFDFISPYAYLAFEELPQALAGLSYSVRYKPVFFGGLLQHTGQLGAGRVAGQA